MSRLAVRRSISVAEAALIVFAATAVVGFTRGVGGGAVWLLTLPALAATAVELKTVSDPGRGFVNRLVYGLLLAALVLSLGWAFYLILEQQTLTDFRLWIGSGLVLLVAPLLAAPHVWRPGRTLVPAGMALLLLTAMNQGATSTVAPIVAAGALVMWGATSRPDGPRGPRSWTPAPIGLALVVVLASAGAVGLARLLPAAQPIAEELLRDMDRGGGRGQSGLATSGELGAVEEIALSREVVLRMWAERPVMLRSQVLAHFDGRRWTADEAADGAGPEAPPAGSRTVVGVNGGGAGTRPLPEAGHVPADVGDQLAEIPGSTYGTAIPEPGAATGAEGGDGLASALDWARILLASGARGQMPVPAGTRLVRMEPGPPRVAPGGVVTPPFQPPPDLYGTAFGARATPTLDPAERATALQVPDDVDGRMVVAAEQIAAAAATERDKVEATVAWLAGCCTYALDVGAFESEQPVAEFLFDKQRGYCEYFASAAALLLRLQGVPARYVTGLSVQPANRRGEHYLLRGSDAHAWIDVWIEGEGWVEVDPTPPAQYANLRLGLDAGWLGRTWESVSAFWAEFNARFGASTTGGFAWLAAEAWGLLVRLAWLWAGILVAAATWVGLRWWGSKRRAAGRIRAVGAASFVGAELAALVDGVEARWAGAGRPRPAHRAPLEHLEGMAPDALPEELRQLSRDVVDLYYRVRFGGVEASTEELGRLGRSLAALGTLGTSD